ncbi:hypothetical protein D3C76_1184990 [compost metagenome]
MAQNQAGQGLVHVLGGDAAMVNGLDLDQRAIGAHREWRCADVAATGQGVTRRTAAALGQAITQRLSARLPQLAQYFDATVLAQERQDFFQHRAGQGQALYQPRHVQHTGVVQVLAHQLTEETVAQAGVANGAGLWRQALYRFPFAGVGIAIVDDVHD